MKKKILVVEDDPTLRSVLADMLGRTYQVQTAENGKIARDLLALQSFDLVLSDVKVLT